MIDIKITRTSKSTLHEVDFSNLPFGKITSDHMFVADYKDGEWHNPRIEPVHELSLHPSTMALHYGQTIFEGMKASITEDGVPLLMRQELHWERFNKSAHRMCMPEIPADIFLGGLNALVYLEKDWIPKSVGSSLYLRPFMIATDAFIGVAPSKEYKFIILTLPVGPYYAKPIKLLAEHKYIRAVRGGVGEAKNGGNYGGALYPSKLAREKGFDQVLWLDAFNYEELQEVGTMNIFCVVNGKVLTPSLDGAILDGITRKCAIEILKRKGYEVEERPITIHELIDAYKAGTFTEMFGTGTAAVVSNIDKLCYKEIEMNLSHDHFEVSNLVKNEINGLRNGSIPDVYHWFVPAKG